MIYSELLARFQRNVDIIGGVSIYQHFGQVLVSCLNVLVKNWRLYISSFIRYGWYNVSAFLSENIKTRG